MSVNLIGGLYWKAEGSSTSPERCFHPLHQRSSVFPGLECPGDQPPCIPQIKLCHQTSGHADSSGQDSTDKASEVYLYSAGVCSHLTWPLLTQEFPITWVERELDSLATRYIKHWAGLAKSASTAILYLHHSTGGLNLPRLSTVYKTLQVFHQTQLLTSRDGCVCFLADRNLR